jgi:hypothetical protein
MWKDGLPYQRWKISKDIVTKRWKWVAEGSGVEDMQLI